MNLINTIVNSPWMIHNESAMAFAPQILSLIKGKRVNFMHAGNKDAEVESSVALYKVASTSENSAESNIAVVSIKGVITKADQMCGPEGTQSINQHIKALAADSKISAIVLDMDTPGGQANFLQTLTSTINSAKAKKPILAYYSGMCASCLLYTSPSPRDRTRSRMPSSA